MPVDVTAMKNFPSKRGSRLTRARSSARRSRPRIASISSRYAAPPGSTSRFRTSIAARGFYGESGRPTSGTNRTGSSRFVLERVAVRVEQHQLLLVAADRDHEPSAVAQLLASARSGICGRRGGDDDRVEGRLLRPALVAVARAHVDVAVAEPRERRRARSRASGATISIV